MKTRNTHNHVVIILTDRQGPVYLGSADVDDVQGNGRTRSGVRRLENATRFTEAGAKRVAKGYAGATTTEAR